MSNQTAQNDLLQKKLCNCVLSDDPGPTPVCDEFDRDEDGCCFICGHAETCHVE